MSRGHGAGTIIVSAKWEIFYENGETENKRTRNKHLLVFLNRGQQNVSADAVKRTWSCCYNRKCQMAKF